MKKFKWLYLALFVFLIGCFYTMLIYNGVWFKLISGLKSLSFFGYILWFVFAFYFTLTLHELGHFIAFYVQKVKLRALYLTIFVFYKNEKGWHFTIKPKLWILFGGLVVPDLGEIKNEEEYQALSAKFRKSLIAAPIVTIIVMALSIIIFILLMIFSTNAHLNGIMSINALYITLISILYIYTFRLSNQMFYGDFVAYRKMNEDPVFKLAQINQYTMFSSVDSEETIRFMWEKSRDTIKNLPLSTSMFYNMIITNYIDGLLKMNYEFDLEVENKLRHLNLNALCRNEQGLNLAYDLCFYDYKKGHVEQAYQKFDRIQNKISKKLDEKMVLYLKNKTLHVMNREDHTKFLNNKENLYIGQSWIFDALIDPYEMLIAYHQKLPYVEYSCPVVFEEIEEQKSDLS